jgi:inosine-uridine nucleoside N-ribohydrolase
VIIDTDIGGDIDDAFAVALALRSPELEVLGFSAASGDTTARAKIIDRMLGESGHGNIPVAIGSPTTAVGAFLPPTLIGAQSRYGESLRYARASHPAAVDFILEQIQRFPQQITLVTIGPLSNVGALIDKDIVSFRKLKRVVMMGGWIGQVEDDVGLLGRRTDPHPEYNIAMDIRSAQKLFRSGVPVYVVPLDSTIHLNLEEVNRRAVFSETTPLTDALGLLYLLWGATTPVLHDALAVAVVVDPELCPVKPARIVVDDGGITRVDPGIPNAQLCLHSDRKQFVDFYMGRVAGSGRSAGSSFSY